MSHKKKQNQQDNFKDKPQTSSQTNSGKSTDSFDDDHEPTVH